jgi:hypothetical protein
MPLTRKALPPDEEFQSPDFGILMPASDGKRD